MDADYLLTDQFIKEIQTLSPSPSFMAYEARFTYAINGQNLPGSLYPPRTVLYQRKFARYRQDGHTQRVVINGNVGKLEGKIIHDDRKSHQRWLTSQYNYAEKEQQKFINTDFTRLSWPDKIRRIPDLALLPIIPYLLFAKGLLFSGKPGLIYIKQRLQAEWILQKALITKPR